MYEKQRISTLLLLIVMVTAPLVFETLLEAWADLEAKDEKGGTALVYAKKNRHRKVVRLLEEAGAK